MVWTEKAVKTLCSLWSKGVPAREIGKRLGGISRNAVIGMAHRLGLSNQLGGGDTRVRRQLLEPRISLRKCADGQLGIQEMTISGFVVSLASQPGRIVVNIAFKPIGVALKRRPKNGR